MKKITWFLFCTYSCIVLSQDLSELKNYIMKTNLNGVTSKLSTTLLTEKAKAGLIDLANDIILMRLKTAEIFSYKRYSQMEIDLIKGSLSAPIINEIEQLEKKVDRLKVYGKIYSMAFSLSILGFLRVPAIFLEQPHWFDVLAAIGLTILPVVMLIMARDMVDQWRETRTSIMKKIWDNLHKYYNDAMLIKQLIIDAEVST